jgi:hypothetical protein
MRLLAVLTACVLTIAGCGRRESAPAEKNTPTFEELADTTGLSEGPEVIRTFEPYRMENQALRARGRLRFPDGTRVQLSVYPVGTTTLLARVQFEVSGGQFDTPPILGSGGPLPHGHYHFELMTYFDRAWQPPEVMEATGNGRDLRGPGITRGRNGEAAFVHTEDHRL